MSYVSELRKFYPRTWKERIALERYKLHCQWEGQEPTTITIHDTYLCYGGPEEGGWYYHQGHPLQTICISPRSKQSTPISNTQKSMRSGTMQALGFQQRSQPSKSTSATTSLSSIPSNDHYSLLMQHNISVML